MACTVEDRFELFFKQLQPGVFAHPARSDACKDGNACPPSRAPLRHPGNINILTNVRSHTEMFQAPVSSRQSMVAPLAPTPECTRSEGAACSEVAPGQTCSGRLALTAAAAAAAARSRADVRSDLVERAHARGLVVHPYTFRNEVPQSIAAFACQHTTQHKARAILKRSTDLGALSQSLLGLLNRSCHSCNRQRSMATCNSSYFYLQTNETRKSGSACSDFSCAPRFSLSQVHYSCAGC